MFIHFSRFHNVLFLVLLSIFAETAFASPHIQSASEPAMDRANNHKATSEPNALKTATGLVMLDYEVIPVPGNKDLDLFGVHYFHQLNRWLYLGLGANAPLVDGDYGGFLAFDATLHAQRTIFGNSFIDAGASLGGGGGGSSVDQSRKLSGEGGYIKSYIGLGHHFRGFSIGLNYAHFQFMNSLINHSQFDFFIQKSFSYSIGSYADSGKETTSSFTFPDLGENILTLEFNNILQIEPEGSNKNTINAFSLQFLHFLTRKYYLFFEAEVGCYGLPLYNQVLGGMGYMYSISPRVNLYGQIGAGSGGYSPDVIDTGPGLLIYPKISVEYLLNNKLGLSLSSGYLFAPEGSSKNLTIGAALNYHLSTEGKNLRGFRTAHGGVFRGFRFNLFQQTEFKVRVGNKKRGDIGLLSVQLDKIINDNWYIPFQASVAYNSFLGYPGYGEILTGLGVQSKFSKTNNFQSFFQILIGTNVHGVVLKPSIGLNYGLSDNLALYCQIGRTISLDKLNLYPDRLRFNANFVALGLTYRFSLLDTFNK